MHDDCPSRATLRAFSSGGLSEHESAELHEHLSACLDCARELDEMTRAQLAGLGVEHVAAAQATYVSGKAVSQLIREAQKGFSDGPAADVEAGIRPGSTFAGYEVIEVAGRGGMGVVLEARDPMLQRTVAIKVLSASHMFSKELASRFLREARTIAAIEHDHVAVIHSAGQEEGLPYLVMPFYGAGTLEQYFEHTPRLPFADVVRLGIQLSRALEVTHAQGVLHRDIKPSNVLLDGGLDRVRLADFGLAQAVGESSGAGRIVAGTPHYMSPEQARAEAVDVRSDLFGLGALLYQAATGQTIYDGDSAEEILKQARRGHPVSTRETKSEVPPALAAVIDRLVAARPEDRFASASEVVAALESVQSPARRNRRLVRRVALALATVCLAALVTVVGLDLSGRTALINSFLCARTGDGYFIRGRLGTHTLLADAVKASRSGEIIEARFSGERVTGDFRLRGKAVTIRAAKGFTPSLYATNNTHPFILADGPLTLEGLILVRRSKGAAFTGLVEAQGAPVFLLNCRFVRGLPQTGGDMLIRAERLITIDETNRPAPPLIVMAPGSSCLMRNCLVVGMTGTALSMLDGAAPVRVRIENSLLATYRSFLLRPESSFEGRLDVSASVLACQVLMELGNAEAIQNATVNWKDSVIKVSQGTLLRLNRLGAAGWRHGVKWSETNVIYALEGDFIWDRRGRRVSTETEWNSLMGVTRHSHAWAKQRVFQDVRARTNHQLAGTDVNASGLREATGVSLNFAGDITGEGRAYDAFRERPEYVEWRAKVRAISEAWAREMPLQKETKGTK